MLMHRCRIEKCFSTYIAELSCNVIGRSGYIVALVALDATILLLRPSSRIGVRFVCVGN